MSVSYAFSFQFNIEVDAPGTLLRYEKM